MRELEASSNKILQIGYEGEDNVTTIKFLYDEEWLSHGNGEFKVRVLRNGDIQAYNATQIVDDRENMTLTMTVTDIEFSKKGRGELQLVYICSGAIKKSQIYRYNVNRAIDSEIVNPPQGSIINELAQSVGDLSELTTTDKSSIVEAINEVNAKEVEVTVDSELSAVSTNPLQNKVITGAFIDALETLSGKADKSYVDTELAGKANTADMNTALSAKANTADMNTALALKANSADVQTALAGKASTDVATQSANGLMSSADKTKLDGLGNSGVSDVQVNGTSVVTDGVAEIPIATSAIPGVVKIGSGLRKSANNDGSILVNCASPGEIRSASDSYKPLVPIYISNVAFFGLAKAAGDTTQKNIMEIGTYTETAKSKISDMLNGAVTVSGTTPTITALSGVRYICGEVATLDITPCASGICDIVFTSGSTATVLTLPNTVKFPDGAFTPEANTTYEINILDGIYGAVMAWT